MMENNNQQQPKVVKNIFPIDCPHCGETILIDFQTGIPNLTGVLKPQQCKEAKTELKKRLEEIEFKDIKEKTNIIAWLDQENTLIGPDDIEPVLKEIITRQTKNNDNTQKDTNN